MTCT